MPVLKNPTHEAMARDVAGGMSEWAAWLAAGNDPKNRNYRRLFKRKEVVARIAELRDEFNEAASIHLRYLQEKLLAIVMTDVTEFFEQRPYSTALRLKDPKTLPAHMRVAVSEMYVDKNGKVGVKLESKTHALDSLLKTIGGFAPERVDARVLNMNATPDGNITDQARVRALSALLAKVKAKSEAA
jgi:hypothetical protein